VCAPAEESTAVKNGWNWLLFGWGLFFAVVLLGMLGGCAVGFTPWAQELRGFENPPLQFGGLGFYAGLVLGIILLIIRGKKPEQ
jgi:hypothetical protein